MVKSLVTYVLVFVSVFFIAYNTQDFVINTYKINIRYSFYDTTLFFAVASALICVNLKLITLVKNLKPQVGLIYLPTLFIKGGFFFLAFQSTVFAIENLSINERLCLLFSLFVFLALEVFFVIKIIKE